MSKRLIAVAPGRGSYSRETLNCLSRRDWSQAALELLAQADQYRQETGAPTISELDAAEKFSAVKHQKGENASALTYTLSCMDFCELQESGHKIVAVTGNSLGWYTTLYTSGALSFLDGLKIVEAMGQRQKNNIVGGQIIVPIVNEQWQIVDDRLNDVLATIHAVNNQGPDYLLELSIDLGGMLVIAGTQLGLDDFCQRTEKVKIGRIEYPFQLAFHSAFHTSLMAAASAFGLETFANQTLNWRSLDRCAIDGRGYCWRPHGASDPSQLRNYTFAAQVYDTYSFRKAVQYSILEFQPDQVVLLGPGDSLGSSIAQTMIASHWRNLSNKAEFMAEQKLDSRPLVALGRDEQRQQLLQLA